MNCMETTETRQSDAGTECIINMPLGMLGFEQYKKFALLTNPAEEPFLRLQVLDDPQLAFLVISPFVVLPAYEPDISDEDAEFLGIQQPEDTLIFNIVAVHNPRQATVNLKGPIVLNRRTLLAKQVIPLNAPDYSVAHPLPVQAA
jgi:flagellar assembly factor FliW